jgi:hypothetical protein
LEVNYLSKINPGSNDLGDNDVRTANMENMGLPEPNVRADGMLECPICGKTFHSREAYAGHATVKHSDFKPEKPQEEPTTAPMEQTM